MDPDTHAKFAALEAEIAALKLRVTALEPKGAQGTLSPAGWIHPKADFANIRRAPSITSEDVGDLAAPRQILTRTDTPDSQGYRWYRIAENEYVREDVVVYSPDRPQSGTGGKWPLPSSGRITSTHHDASSHDGIDIAAPIGNPVFAGPNSGYVAKVMICIPCGTNPLTQTKHGISDPAYSYGYGHAVVVRYEHPLPGRTRYLYAIYAHLSRIDVTDRQVLTPGRKIGDVGQSGNAYGAHLHLALRESDDPSADWYRLKGREIDPDEVFAY